MLIPSKHIGSANPEDPPLIDPQYFDNDTDVDILVEGFRFTRQVCATEPFASLVEAEVSPGPSVQTDDEIKGETTASPNNHRITDLYVSRQNICGHRFTLRGVSIFVVATVVRVLIGCACARHLW